MVRDALALALRAAFPKADAALRANYPSAPLVIVSATRNAAAMRQVVEMGAAGFIPKSAPMEEIIASVRAVMRGEIVLPPGASDGVLLLLLLRARRPLRDQGAQLRGLHGLEQDVDPLAARYRDSGGVAVGG